jgi:hypothetical protein
VAKVDLYVAEGEPGPQTAALRRYSKQFLHWRNVSGQLPDESESQFVRRKCMEENVGAYAFITFLHTHDYIMPRGNDKNRYGQLKTILRTLEFRFAPGVLPLCVLCFGRCVMCAAASSSSWLIIPGSCHSVRQREDCCSMHAPSRMQHAAFITNVG